MLLHQPEERFVATTDGKCAVGERGMVAAGFPEAVDAGVTTLAQGGNAVDAACATALALGVCEPAGSGLGGQSLALVHVDGRTVAVDGSSRAPSLAHRQVFQFPEEVDVGAKASTVPSTVALVGYLSRRYGRLPWPQVVEPAIRIAQGGYQITTFQRERQQEKLEGFLSVPSRSGARYFLKNGQEPYQVGESFVQPDLARTLTHLAEHGPESFYGGRIARSIDEDMRDQGGLVRAEDLALIPWPVERTPLQGRYRGLTVVSTPPPTSGYALLLTLALLDQVPSDFLAQDTLTTMRFQVEVIRQANLLRRERPYHPTFFPRLDSSYLEPQRIDELVRAIREGSVPNVPLRDGPMEGGETTHLSVVDAAGNAVAISQSVYEVYGSQSAAQGLGFVYNNYMQRFDQEDPSHPYYLRPNAIPFTAVAPTMLLREGEPWLVIGTPGAERIFATLSLFLVDLIDRGMPLGEAMSRARLHCEPGGLVHIEGGWRHPELAAYLRAVGYLVEERDPLSYFFGGVHAVMRCRSRSELHGAADLRRDGIARGV